MLCTISLTVGLVTGQVGAYVHDHEAGHDHAHHHQDDHDHTGTLDVADGGMDCTNDPCGEQHRETGLHSHDTGVKLYAIDIAISPGLRSPLVWAPPPNRDGEWCSGSSLERPPRST